MLSSGQATNVPLIARDLYKTGTRQHSSGPGRGALGPACPQEAIDCSSAIFSGITSSELPALQWRAPHTCPHRQPWITGHKTKKWQCEKDLLGGGRVDGDGRETDTEMNITRIYEIKVKLLKNKLKNTVSGTLPSPFPSSCGVFHVWVLPEARGPGVLHDSRAPRRTLPFWFSQHQERWAPATEHTQQEEVVLPDRRGRVTIPRCSHGKASSDELKWISIGEKCL